MGPGQVGLTLVEYAAAGATVVVAGGVLDHSTYGRFRNHLLKCAAEAPSAIVVDVSGLSVPNPTVLSVFVAVDTRVSPWAGVPVSVVSPAHEDSPVPPDSPIRRFVPVFPSIAVALAATMRPIRRAVVSELPNDHAAMAVGRAMVREFCDAWDLGWAADTALMIANELVQNTIQHTLSAPRLRLELRRRLLTIAVHDEHPFCPPTPTGHGFHGLDIVVRLCDAWGATPTPDGGKVVWATLREPVSP
ncbi:ATP-binding protein [Actinokineospora globicatena]|uniref:ATP-binding protein n=1 Tax=Actinokineospora globicatena TaxID=103729 RepID=UPI0020A38AE2|nr:ATP-binding protein [Actinokineospora globicatena]MCP2303029.1 hypothetical protein [Actinokineospora globicatena]GLW79861.1 ATP-binding protein [Actinokineospora globicatena]GLW85729.1 ATP-binding protein [Actinokineospora globicatena]